MWQGYGAVGGKETFGPEQYGELPMADRAALLEEYNQERGSTQDAFPSIKGILDGSFFGHGRVQQQDEPAQSQTKQGRMVLVCMCVLIGGASFASSSTVPIFESLRDSIGFSSLQVTALNSAPLFFATAFTLPAAAFTENCALWDLLAWSCASLMLGTWVSACALMGSPLEYMLLGQWFVGLAIAFLVPAPAKFAVFWNPDQGRRVASTAWVGSMLVGMGLPFLIVPILCGGDGQGRHLGSFLLCKALFGTVLCVIFLWMRYVAVSSGTNEEEEAFYRRFHTHSFRASLGQVIGNAQLVKVLLALSLSISVGFSFYMFLPFVYSLPPASLTPLQAGVHLWGLAPAGILGILMVRSRFLLNLEESRSYKPAILACVAGSAAFLIFFAIIWGRTSTVVLTLVACGFAGCCAPLLHIAAELTLDLAYPVPETTSSAATATVVLLVSTFGPIASICITHPMVLSYSTDTESPTGMLLSFAACFWVVALVVAFTAVVFLYSDSASRLMVDTEPKLVSHVAFKVAQDLRDARAASERAIPLPERLRQHETLQQP